MKLFQNLISLPRAWMRPQNVTKLPRAWIRLPSGARLDLINPSPRAWLDSDLATRLSRTYRWSGESNALPLSVAQHCLTVLALRRQCANSPLTPVQELMELLHDAEEGFIGFDCISPLKAELGKPFKAVSDRLIKAIWDRYELPDWHPNDYALHKEADWIAAASEAFHCVGWSLDEIRDVLEITHPVLDADPLVELYGCTPWEPWAPEVAAMRFLDELNRLMDLAHEEAHEEMRRFA